MSKTTIIKLKCYLCGQAPKNTQEVLEINEYGCHVGCDHVYADVLADQKGQTND